MPCSHGCLLKPLVEAMTGAVCKGLEQPEPDRLISAEEACKRLGWSRRTLDRQRKSLPFVKLRPTRGYDVILSRLELYIREH